MAYSRQQCLEKAEKSLEYMDEGVTGSDQYNPFPRAAAHALEAIAWTLYAEWAPLSTDKAPF